MKTENLIRIDAVDVIMKRIVTILPFSKACNLYGELIEAGYEEKNIQFEFCTKRTGE